MSWLTCPSCGKGFGCPCEACKENFPDDEPRQIRTTVVHKGTSVDLESCPHCMFTATNYWWEDFCYELHKGRIPKDKTIGDMINERHFFPGMKLTLLSLTGKAPPW